MTEFEQVLSAMNHTRNFLKTKNSILRGNEIMIEDELVRKKESCRKYEQMLELQSKRFHNKKVESDKFKHPILSKMNIQFFQQFLKK